MTLVPFAILCGIILIIIGTNYSFYRKNAALRSAHELLVNGLELNIETHKRQLFFRVENLNKYHFLRYNLRESLVVQPEINV